MAEVSEQAEVAEVTEVIKHIEPQIYHSDIIMTSDQEEEDHAYGITERGKRRLTINWETKQVSFLESYYYRYELHYKCQCNKIVEVNLKGTFTGQKEDQQFKCETAGSYIKDYFNNGKVNKDDIKQCSCSFTIKRGPSGLYISKVVLKDGQNQIKSPVIDRPQLPFVKI